MFITNKKELENFYAEKRLWQGIPGLEITDNGRMFACFYSGGKTEQLGNYCLLIKSDDNAKTWTEPIAVVYVGETSRAYDPCLWIDPQKRLWLFYSVAPIQKTYAVICEEPDAETLVWGDPFEVGEEVMMNKPTVLSSGEWLFPIAVWGLGVQHILKKLDERDKDRMAFCYSSWDNGKTIEKIGGVDVPNKSFDEHMFLELKDGRVAVYVRTKYGIAVSHSSDKGRTWSEPKNTGLFGPDSRFFIRRLQSGNVLLVNHVISEPEYMEEEKKEKTRKNLTAYLSTDDGETWQGGLLLDERLNVSYPDGVQTKDGYIHIIYDREREKAREILYTKFTEADVLAKAYVDKTSVQKHLISKLYTQRD